MFSLVYFCKFFKSHVTSWIVPMIFSFLLWFICSVLFPGVFNQFVLSTVFIDFLKVFNHHIFNFYFSSFCSLYFSHFIKAVSSLFFQISCFPHCLNFPCFFSFFNFLHHFLSFRVFPHMPGNYWLAFLLEKR